MASNNNDLRDSQPQVGRVTHGNQSTGLLRSWIFWVGVTVLILAVLGLRLGLEQLVPEESGDVAPEEPQVAWDFPVPEIPPETTTEYQRLMEETRDIIVAALKAHPNSPDAISALGLFHYLCHDRLGEMKCWEHCLEVAPGYMLAYKRLVARCEENADFDRVVEMMREAVKSDPHNVIYNGYLASALMYSNRPEEAKKVLETLHQHTSGNAETHLVLGRIYDQLGELDKAQRELETSFALDPTRVDVWFNLATVYGKLGEKKRSARYLKHFQKIKKDQLVEESRRSREENDDARFLPPRVAEILCYAGKAYWFNGQLDAAEGCFRKAAEVDPENVESRQYLSELCGQRNQLDEALRWVLELKKIQPQNLLHYRNEGLIYAKQQRWQDAERVFMDICQLEPYRGFGYFALADLLLRVHNKRDEAKRLAEQGVRAEPTPENFSALANIYARAGDWNSADRAIRRAMELDPDNPQYRQFQEVIREHL